MNTLAVLRDKKIMRAIAAIAIPVALQNLITYMTGMLDTVMLGQLGEVALSGSALANQYGNIFMGLSFGIAGGTNVLLSQYWGKGDVKSMRSILAIMYRVIIAVSLLFVAAGYFFPTQILSVFSGDPEVIAAGAEYLKIVCFSYLFSGLANVMLMSLRSVGTVKIAIFVYISSLLVNAVFNWLLIFGNLGFPRLEMAGAAIATVLARGVEAAIGAVFIFGFEKKIVMKVKNLLRYDRSFLRDYGVNVTPVMINEILWSLGSSTLMVIMGRMGRDVVAANAISGVTNYFVLIIIIGVGNAASVIIGNTIGAEQYQRARDISKALMVMAAGLGCVAGLLFFAVRPFVVELYNVSDATKALAMQLMAVMSLVSFFQSLTFTGLMGILRGGGDNKFVIFCDAAFLWCFSIPLGYMAGLRWGWPIWLVFIMLRGDEVLKLAACLIRIWRGKWVRNLTRQEETVSDE